MPFRCRIIHAIRGRIRLYIESIRLFDDEDAGAFKAFLQDQEGIQGVRLNRNCRCVILTYCPDLLTEDDLVRAIEELSLDALKYYQGKSAGGEFRSCDASVADVSSWLPLALSSAAVVLGTVSESALVPWFLIGASIPIFSRAFNSLIAQKGKLNVDVLDASATAVLTFRGQFTTAAGMVWLVSLGNFIRDATVQHSHRAIEKLFDGLDQFAWVVRDGKKIQIKVEAIRVGDEVVVYPGELIPVDGTILAGKATVDQKILTGESLPVEKGTGSLVYAGTVVREGKLYIKAEKVGAETAKSKIVQLVNNAPIRETKAQNYAEQFANRFVPWSFLAAGTSFVITGNTGTTASLLIVDYGTGIRVAAPTTVLSSMAKAAHHGILIKGGRYLELLAEVDTIVFDKTGTLTVGEPEVVEIIPHGRHKITSEQILALAAAAEARLTHPVAEAIARAAQQQGIAIPEREASEYVIGLGVEASVGGSTVLVGCHRFMTLKKIRIGKTANSDIARLNGRAAAPLFIALDGRLIGLLIYTDPIRPEAPSVVQALRRCGVETLVMLTGDHPAIAQKVANKLGITRFVADAFPEEKAEVVKSLQREGHTVAVVGDGINDTPALVQADVGIAVRGGADVAMETAHVSFLEGNLWKIPQAIDIARESSHLIRQNWKINFYPNTGAIALALVGAIGPIATTIISNGSAIVASLNALRPMIYRSTQFNGSSPKPDGYPEDTAAS
ncbi:MAG: heavy metal translocating P-type ATPase [bacterium]